MRTIRTPEKAQALAEAIVSAGGNVTAACKAVGISRNAVYAWRNEDEEFAAAFDLAVDQGVDALEDEAVRRAFDGTEKPMFHAGKVCGTVREYSDALLIFMLKARRPQKFKDRAVYKHTGAGGGPLLVEHAIVDRPPNETRDQWIERRNRELAAGIGNTLIPQLGGMR